MIEQVFPLHCLAIAGLVAFAATRGLRSFPFKLTAMYAAFFYTSAFISYSGLAPEFQLVTAFIFACILFNYVIKTKRRLYIDLFCLLMILAIINYILLYVSYIALEGNAYEVASHLYTVGHVLLSLFDIAILIGVVNGSRSDRVYEGLPNFITNGLLRSNLFLQAPQKNEGPTRQTQAQKGSSING